jgi:uncharacterized protein YndB with AHSA1/START domain
MRSILRSPDLSLFVALQLILAVPALAIGYSAVAGSQAQPLTKAFYAASLFCVLPASVAFVISLLLRPAGSMLNMQATNRQTTAAVLGFAFVIDSVAFNPGILWLPAGLPISAFAIGWVIFWSIPRLRRGRMVTSFVVRQSPAIVFDFVTDLRNLPRWRPEHLWVELITPEPIGPGSRFRELAKLPRGKEVIGEEELIDYEPGRRMTSRTVGLGMSPNLDEFTFEPTADGTLVTHSFAFEYPFVTAVGGGRLLLLFANRTVLKFRKAGADRVKQILEN